MRCIDYSYNNIPRSIGLTLSDKMAIFCCYTGKFSYKSFRNSHTFKKNGKVLVMLSKATACRTSIKTISWVESHPRTICAILFSNPSIILDRKIFLKRFYYIFNGKVGPPLDGNNLHMIKSISTTLGRESLEDHFTGFIQASLGKIQGLPKTFL